MRQKGLGFGVLVGLVFFSGLSRADSPDERFSLLVEVGPAFYRYTETGRGEFAGVETEWSQVAFLGALEGRYRTPVSIVPLLRFSGLTSGADEETNNLGSPPNDLRIAYFFNLLPAVQYELHPHPSIVLAPELAWDLDWYRQARKTPDAGTVDESVFWQGPAVGGEVFYAIGEDWLAALGYRHSFLVDVTVSNDFTSDLGFGDFSTDGDRDVLKLRLSRRIADRWRITLGYGFDSARINASDTATRPSGFLGSAQAQFPENHHTVHFLGLGVSVSF